MQCEPLCAFGFATDPETGCEVCQCAGEPAQSECIAAGGTCHVGLISGCDDTDEWYQ